MNYEIERKWLFNGMNVPEGMDIFNECTVEQTYISIDPEVRLRKCSFKDGRESQYLLTFKTKGSLTRGEEEIDITEEQYNHLIEMFNLSDKIIKKEFAEHHIGSHILQLGNVYTKCGKIDFSYGEIEFQSEEEAQGFITPSWFGEDITHSSAFKMCNYWKRTYTDEKIGEGESLGLIHRRAFAKPHFNNEEVKNNE